MKGDDGVEQKRTACVQGGGRLAHLSTYAKTSLLHAFYDIFVCKVPFIILCCLWRRGSLLFYETFAMTIFMPLECFTIFFSKELLIGYLKTFSLEIGSGSDR